MAHTMPAASALRILDALAVAGVTTTVGGGWGVDALLQEQTREHSDLDIRLPAEHLDRLTRAMAAEGIDRMLPWPGDRPWNFVLHDGATLRLDLHLYETLPDSDLHYGSVNTPVTFPAAALAGRGVIDGCTVRCEAPEWALRWHTGYPARAVDRHDVPLLCVRYGLAPPQLT